MVVMVAEEKAREVMAEAEAGEDAMAAVKWVALMAKEATGVVRVVETATAGAVRMVENEVAEVGVD